MNPQPKISIITPSYNQGRFIEETIKSVLDQGYPNIELIIIDGGSTDNTVEILKKYDGKIKWVSEKDRGQSDAIIKGFMVASGEILTWLCSDDIYLPGALSKIAGHFEANPKLALLFGKSHYIDEAGKLVGEYPTGEFDHEEMATFNMISQPSAFFTKEAYINSGGLDVELTYAMDYDLWLRITKEGRVEYIPEFLSSYRLHDKSKTVSNFHALKQSKEILDTVRKYFSFSPLNRIYVYSYLLIKDNLPCPIKSLSPVIIPTAAVLTIILSIKYNKGISLRELRSVNIENIAKILKG